MRKNIVAGNWKMNMLSQEAELLMEAIEDGQANCELIVACPSLYLQSAQAKKYTFSLSAQNCHHESSGAYTGELSASMLASLELKYCIIGHSERRAYQNETDKMITQKFDQLAKSGLTPILCVGESLDIRQSGDHLNFVANQLKYVLDHCSSQVDFILAYEPVWAIGTGETASPEQAQEMHQHLRSVLKTYQKENTSILYGGSCKPGNAKELFAQNDIDGGLIGGAALKAESFLAIANSF
jgi:triosephosphate isomerase